MVFCMLTAGVALATPIMASIAASGAAVDYAKWLNSKQPYLEPCPPSPGGEGDEEVLNRVVGSMMGLACGDAMGAYFEFDTPYRIREIKQKLGSNMSKMKGSQDFKRSHDLVGMYGNLEKGAWTDDTSMALCLASSLLVMGRHDPCDQLERYERWVNRGYLSSTGACFDVGAGTRASLAVFRTRMRRLLAGGMSRDEARAAVDCMCAEKNSAGNGCLMRLAPVPIFFSRDVEEAIRYSEESAGTTHDVVHTRVAADACRYFGALVACAVRGYSKERLLSSEFCKEFSGLENLCREVAEISQKSYKGMRVSPEWSTNCNGYVLISLEAALWAFANDGDSFEKGVMDIIELFGHDTDTIAAIYGQLAGACYGVGGIKAEWVEDLMYGDFIRCISTHLYYAGAQRHRE